MYSWDPQKSRSNKAKHGFSFEEILEVFDDPHLVALIDGEHSFREERIKYLGCLGVSKIILVIGVHRSGSLRIISARKATPYEVGLYYGNIKRKT